MVMLTDLLERKRALEEENERIQRDLGLLRQIDELAKQLGEPHFSEPHIPEPPEPGPDHEVHRIRVGTTPEDLITPAANGASAATPDTLPDAPPAPPPPPRPPAPPGTVEPEAQAKPKRVNRPPGEARETILDAFRRLRGTALQVDLVKRTGLTSGVTSRTCQQLEAEGVIRRIGKGGYMNKSPKWQLTATEVPAPPPPVARASGAPGLSPRVRKAMEKDAKKAAKGARQPATHEGRILQQLVLKDTMTVGELAAELSIPASTVGRLVGKLREEGEVVDVSGRGDWRRVTL